MGDVFEQIIDGTSGLVGGGVTGALVLGVCSKGEVGKTYLCGNRTDLKEMLGTGTLADRLEDIFSAGGSNAKVIAVPIEGVAQELPTVSKSRAEATDISLSGSSKLSAKVIIEIMRGGELNNGQYRYSFDNGTSFSDVRTLPIDRQWLLEDTGVTLNFAEGNYTAGDKYTFELKAPKPTVDNIMKALERPLELYDVEFIYITGESDATLWNALQVKADEMFSLHRPTFFKAEARLKDESEDINDWVDYLIEERKKVSARFVMVTATYGTVTTAKGKVRLSNLAGIEAGRTLAIPVHRSTGRVRDGALSGVNLTDEYSDAVQSTLEINGFVTAKRYAGVSGVFFSDDKTLADQTSDYQYQTVIRTTFKGLRLARISALKSIKDELGDPTKPDDMTGATMLKTDISVALDTMVQAMPKELVDYKLVIPEGQDFVNNGVGVEMTLIGIPIINKITLFTNYTYAGSKFDPRIKES